MRMTDENVIFTVMREVCNYFIRRNDIRCYEGEVTIDDMFNISIDVPSPYIIIRGSHKNDGLYYMEDKNRIHPKIFEEGDVHPDSETFTGRVWFSYPTQDFLALCHDINRYTESVDMSARPVVSERFGASERAYAKGNSGGTVTWQESFGTALRTYRKNMFEEIW